MEPPPDIHIHPSYLRIFHEINHPRTETPVSELSRDEWSRHHGHRGKRVENGNTGLRLAMRLAYWNRWFYEFVGNKTENEEDSSHVWLPIGILSGHDLRICMNIRYSGVCVCVFVLSFPSPGVIWSLIIPKNPENFALIWSHQITNNGIKLDHK